MSTPSNALTVEEKGRYQKFGIDPKTYSILKVFTDRDQATKYAKSAENLGYVPPWIDVKPIDSGFCFYTSHATYRALGFPSAEEFQDFIEKASNEGPIA